MRFRNCESFNTLCTLETIFPKLQSSFILLLYEKQVSKIVVAFSHRTMRLIPQTATSVDTFQAFSARIPAILHFVRFGFSLKKRKVLDISARFSMDCASFKKMYNLHMQYKGSSALIFLHLLFRDVF